MPGAAAPPWLVGISPLGEDTLMRSLTLAGLGMVLLSAACSFQVGTDNSGGGGGSRAPSQARRAPPPPPPPRGAAPAPPPPPAPAAAPAPAPTPTQASAVSPASRNILQSFSINIAKVQEIKARNPKPCGYQEVAPGNWIHVDCEQYKPSSRAIAHLSARKLAALKAKKTTYKPIGRNPALQDALRRNRYGGARGGSGAPATAAGGTPTGGPAQIGENFPSKVDHRAESLEGPIKNQGGVGSCTAHSLSAALDNAAIRAGNLKPGDRDRMTSPLHVWSRYGLPDMGAAADGNIAQPVSLYTAWPQNDREACMLFMMPGAYADDCSETYNVKAGSWRSDSALMAKYNRSQAEGIYKIASIEKLQVKPPNMEEIQSILATGADIWSAFIIDFPAWSNAGMTNAVIPNYTRSGGGHAVVISGYRETDSGKQFLIHNSWGESWGDKGYAWVSEQTVVQKMYYAYKVKITNGVKKEELTDDDCAPDELVDLGTGLCAVMCGDDRPDNGCKK